MAIVAIEKHTEASPDDVFALATDFRRAAERFRAITKTEVFTEGPTRLGTRFRETQIMFKREASEEMEVTRFDPPKGYDLSAESNGCRYLIALRFKPNGKGTQVEMKFDGTPLSFFSKLMSAVMMPMMLNSMKKACEGDLNDLKTAAESQAKVGAGTA